MSCMLCNSERVQTNRENMPLVGLPHVTLVDVEVRRCADCGDFTMEIPAHSRMIEIVTLALLNKRGKLTGREIRWLRGHMGWSGIQLAEHVGVSAESVSKWEHDHTNQARTADRLIRLLVARQLSEELYPHQALTLVSQNGREPLRLRLRFDASDWHLAQELSASIVADPTRSQWALAG